MVLACYSYHICFTPPDQAPWTAITFTQSTLSNRKVRRLHPADREDDDWDQPLFRPPALIDANFKIYDAPKGS